MNLLISDVPIPSTLPQREDSHYVYLEEQSIRPCVGCFGCWVKTPGKCVIRDDATKIYPLIAKSDRLLYVTRVFCGCYDVPFKTMIERAIPIQQAFIQLRNGETHHVQRRVVPKQAVILAYGDISPREQELFTQLVKRNTHNMLIEQVSVQFLEESQMPEAIEQEVATWHAC